MRNRNREMADAISRLFWENYLKTEPALTMRDVIAVELDKAYDRGFEAGQDAQAALYGKPRAVGPTGRD